MNTDGSGFTLLHQFNSSEGIPAGGLVLSAAGNLLYGTAFCDGVGGTLYALNTDGSGFTILHSFPVITIGAPDNADGTDPNQLMLAGSTLYGTTQAGGRFGSGTIFSLALGLSATVSATPQLVHLGDSIAAVVTALNSAADNITDVQVSGPITVSGAGMVSPKGSSGPTMTSSLAPLATVAFTNLYQATNYGTVTFTGAVTGIGPGGVMTSSPATSPSVSIVPRGDLLLKRASDPVYAGAGVYQKVPIAPQITTNAVETNEVSTFNVEVVNSDSNSVNFTLVAKADNASWSTHYYLGAQDVTAQITNGMSLPTLAPGANLTFTVNTTPTILSTNGIVLMLGWAGNPALTLDAVQAVSAASPVALTMSLHRIRYDGFTQSSLQAGMTDIAAPLQPVSDAGILGSQPVITQGVVADEVTPLLIEVQASSSHLAPFPKGRTFNASARVCGNGALTGPALLRKVYDPSTGAWSTNTSFSLSPTHTNAFLLVGPIASDDVHLTGSSLLAAVQITDQTTASQAGWESFAIRKPPIFLVHGYASPGFWDPAFMQILSSTRPMTTDLDPDNFVVTIRYGQGVVPGYWFNKGAARLPEHD